MRKEIMLKSGLFDKWKPYIEMSGDLLKIWKKDTDGLAESE
jgi:hypothetical protein